MKLENPDLWHLESLDERNAHTCVQMHKHACKRARKIIYVNGAFVGLCVCVFVSVCVLTKALLLGIFGSCTHYYWEFFSYWVFLLGTKND